MQEAPSNHQNSQTHPPTKKARRTESDWYEIISNYQTSGLTQQAYCEQHAIPYSSFTNWIAKFKKKNTPSLKDKNQSALFVELAEDNPTVSRARNDWDVELAFTNGMILRLKPR